MATFSAKAKNDLSCPICFELLCGPHTPKELNCSHVCCEVCLKELVKKKGPTIDCPECRLQTCIPTDGVSALKTNLRLRSIAETFDKHEEDEDDKDEEDDEKEAVHDTISSNPHSVCSHTSEEDDLFYCSVCDCVACSPCIALNHVGHDYQMIQNEHEDIVTFSELQKGEWITHNSPDDIKVDIVEGQHVTSKSSTVSEFDRYFDGIWNEKRCRLELVQQFTNFKDASAISTTPKGLLLVCDKKKKEVHVYRQKKWKYKISRTLHPATKDEKNAPHDAAVNAEGQYLVAKKAHVEVYSESGKSEGTRVFQQRGGNNKAHQIKVTQDGKILILNLETSCITVYDSASEYVASIKPENKMVIVSRMIPCPQEHVAVMQAGTGPQSSIDIIDLDSCKTITTVHIPAAYGFCYHAQTNCFFIARHKMIKKRVTGVIEQYCGGTGRLIACVVEGLYYPQDLTITHDGMLAVADSKTVNIYKIMYEN